MKNYFSDFLNTLEELCFPNSKKRLEQCSSVNNSKPNNGSYYEEQMINGKMCYRRPPNNKWSECVTGLNGYR